MKKIIKVTMTAFPDKHTITKEPQIQVCASVWILGIYIGTWRNWIVNPSTYIEN